MNASRQGLVLLVRKVLEQQGRCWVPVTGDSMLPTIAPGARVALEPAPFEQVAPGDVVGFVCQGDLFVHRVVEHRGESLVTRGDNKPLLDPPVDCASYIGRVTACDPLGSDLAAAPLPRPARAPGATRPAQIWALLPQPLEPDELEPLAQAAGVALHRLPRRGLGLAPADLAELQVALPPSALKVGVSSRAVLSLHDALPSLWAAGQIAWVVGGHFGNLEQDGGRLLPLDAVDLHVRCAPPYQDLSVHAEVALIIGLMTALDSAQGNR